MNYLKRKLELDFDSSNLSQRWQRVKEYVHYVEDAHLHKEPKYLKQILQSHTLGDGKIYPNQKSLLYAQIKAKFLAEIPIDAQKTKNSQRSDTSRSKINAFKRLKEVIIFTNFT